MQKIVNPKRETWSEILKRPTQTVDDIEDTVFEIFKDVRQHRNAAVSKYTSIFDGADLDNILVSDKELNESENKIANELKQAIAQAKNNIEAFHKAQEISGNKIETTTGVVCWQEKRPIECVGLYIPGGTAPLFSTVLMLAVPAKIAGCKEIILCTPPNSEGKIADEILYTANLCGITKIYKVGGIQAVAAMTFGTETVLKVDKIFGPGNQFVTVAKQMATKYGVAIDMPAGPSELLVVADDSANAGYVASDLLSQAEHGTDSQVILVSTSKDLIENVEKEIDMQIQELPRKDIAEIAISKSKMIYVENEEIALDLINQYAPEHFIVCTNNNDLFVQGIQNAGSVFIGNYTPESAGDYASGTNHTLPTNGYAKAFSGVNLDSFQKSISFQQISKEGLKSIGNTIELMAEAEGLQAHKNAVSIRLNDLK